MDTLSDPVLLSRIQFAVTAIFHILWPVLTIGLSLFLFALEVLWLKTRDQAYYRHARFWTRLFLLNFTMGVVSGLPMEFQFGANWDRFSVFAGEFFGNVLGFEGAMAFMLEAGFLGIMLFGWERVTPAIHLLSTAMVALGASLSAFWILVANSWMQTPTGGHVEDGRFRVDSYYEAIFNPDMALSFAHMWTACLETSLFAVGGLSAWYLVHNQHTAFFLKSFKLALLAAVLVTPLQVILGDSKGREISHTQPAKLAAIEAHWNTNQPGSGAAWNMLAWPDREAGRNAWAIQVPELLSLLVTKTRTGEVTGLNDIPPENRPPALGLIFYAFRTMAGIGILMLGLMFWTLWAWFNGRLAPRRIGHHRMLLRAWVAAIPLGYVATECGWIVREVGRQPWVVYGLLRTSHAASNLQLSSVATSLAGFVTVYSILLAVFLVFASRILRRGPDLALAPPLANDANHTGRKTQVSHGGEPHHGD